MNLVQSKEELKYILWQINDAWRNDTPQNLEKFLHKNVVFVSPDFRQRGEGREACVNTYREFRRQATLHHYEETDIVIDVFGHTAIATYHYDVTWEMKGKKTTEGGRDLFVFIYEDERWQAVWRTIIPDIEKV